MTDVLGRAADTVERERRLLGGDLDRGEKRVELPIAPWPESARDLVDANAQYHPAALFPGTRLSGAKKVVLRLINVYTYRQILFNAAVVRILNRWDARLRLLVTEATGWPSRVTDWLEARIARLEERRSLWEARLAAQMAALEDRAGAMESDVASLEARVRADRLRIDALEDSVRRLERRLARETERAEADVRS